MKKRKLEKENINYYYDKFLNLNNFDYTYRKKHLVLLVMVFFLFAFSIMLISRKPQILFKIFFGQYEWSRFVVIVHSFYTALLLFMLDVYIILAFRDRKNVNHEISQKYMKDNHKIFYVLYILIITPGILIFWILFIICNRLKLDVIKKYVVEILVAMTFGYVIFALTLGCCENFYDIFPQFSSAILFWWLLIIVFITYLIMNRIIHLSIKYVQKISDWKKEEKKALEQLKLLGIYSLITITIIVYPLQFSEVTEATKIIINMIFFVTNVFTLLGIVMEKRKNN